MSENAYKEKSAALDTIKRQIKLLNWTILLVIYTILFLIVRFIYLVLDYVPTTSVITILTIMAALVLLSTYLANSASRKAIRKIEEYTGKLNTLLTTTKEMREIVYSDLLLDSIVSNALRIIGTEAGSLILKEGDRLLYKVTKGAGVNNVSDLSIPISSGLAGWVLENGRPLRIDDVTKDIRFDPEVDKLKGYEAKSALCAPLRTGSGVIGVLELVNKGQDGFAVEDEEIIQYFADQAATFIERTRFYEDQKNFEIHLTNILIEVMDSILHEKRGHSRRVAKYTLMMANAVGMTEDEKRTLYKASLLHDIGFLRIRADGIVTPEDYWAHSQVGFEILQPINFYADIVPIVLYHHERYDGTGYPSGLSGESIPLLSRMIFIAEAFDAMISRESYKYTGKAFNEEAEPSPYAFDYAVEELKDNAGKQFDPRLVDIFIENISKELIGED